LTRPINVVVPGVAALLIVKLANFIYRSPAQSPLQLGFLAHLGAVVIQGKGFDTRGKVERAGGEIRRGGRSSADDIAIALLSGVTASFVDFPVALLALFATIAGRWRDTASADKSAGIGARKS